MNVYVTLYACACMCVLYMHIISCIYLTTSNLANEANYSNELYKNPNWQEVDQLAM